ncbi:hypothetical protein ABT298_08120, partial [Streptomyces sp. NPDC001034]
IDKGGETGGDGAPYDFAVIHVTPEQVEPASGAAELQGVDRETVVHDEDRLAGRAPERGVDRVRAVVAQEVDRNSSTPSSATSSGSGSGVPRAVRAS